MPGNPCRARLQCAAQHQAAGSDSARRCRHRRQSSFPSLDMEACAGMPHAQSTQRPPPKGHRRSQSFTLEGSRCLPRLSRDRPVLDARVRSLAAAAAAAAAAVHTLSTGTPAAWPATACWHARTCPCCAPVNGHAPTQGSLCLLSIALWEHQVQEETR